MKLGEEECEKCDLHEKHLKDCHRLFKAEFCEISVDGARHMKIFDGCDDCVIFTKHITAAAQARPLYHKGKKREWTEHEVAISVDMQKVIMLPRLSCLKQVIFCERSVRFNETFAPVRGWKKSKTLNLTGVLWHEATKGRSAEDVASAITYFIQKNRDIQSFIFRTDNFPPQNKNWFLFTALVNEVNKKNTAIQTITLKYFEPGHTFMSADSFHHRVEQKMQKKNVLKIFKNLST